MKVDMDQVLLDWLNDRGPVGSPIHFQHLGENPFDRAVIPLPGIWNQPDILGVSPRSYQFALAARLPLSGDFDSRNTDNMKTMRLWQAWALEQDKKGSYPDFGGECGNYRLFNISETPEFVMGFDDGTAQYQVVMALTYDADI